VNKNTPDSDGFYDVIPVNDGGYMDLEYGKHGTFVKLRHISSSPSFENGGKMWYLSISRNVL